MNDGAKQKKGNEEVWEEAREKMGLVIKCFCCFVFFMGKAAVLLMLMMMMIMTTMPKKIDSMNSLLLNGPEA